MKQTRVSIISELCERSVVKSERDKANRRMRETVDTVLMTSS